MAYRPRNIVILPSDVINNNATGNTIADITGLSFPVKSGVTYKFFFFIVYTASSTTNGSRWSVNGPSFTNFTAIARNTVSATAVTTNAINAYDIPASSNATSLATNNIAIIEGIITPSADGIVIGRFAAEENSNAITAKAGISYVEYSILV